MKIALLHYRAGLMDGVSLEMEKWKKVLSRMGHEVEIVAGNDSEKVDLRIKELGFEDEDYEYFFKRSFEEGTISMEEIEGKKDRILRTLISELDHFDLLIPNNIWSLALSIPLGLALEEFASRTSKPFIAHHHDFWWEREKLRNTSSEIVKKILEEHFPPSLKNIVHITINSIAKEELFKRRGLRSVIVPNVMDFSKPISDPELGEKIRREFGLEDGTLVFLQATRITRRKAIELAVRFVKEFEDDVRGMIGETLYNGKKFNGRVVLAFSGMCERGEESYQSRLLEMAKNLDVEVLNLRTKGYDFFDLYSVADVVTYPTILEGWGNQLLEAMCAKKPIVMFEYEVFLRDIKPHGVRYISLGEDYKLKDGMVEVGKATIEKAVKETEEVLFDGERYRSMVEENFEIGRRDFSLEKLQDILKNEVFPSLSS